MGGYTASCFRVRGANSNKPGNDVGMFLSYKVHHRQSNRHAAESI